MNNLINSAINWFRNHPMVITILMVLGVLIVVLLIFLYGVTLKNHLSSWWYSRGTEQAHEQIDKALNEAAANKQIAEEALKELVLEKERGAVERAKRELAETILADRSKNTDAKIAAYNKALESAPTVTPPTTDVDALCTRARAAGIACE
jgi:biopolymer transport protein ExbB/TolQ